MNSNAKFQLFLREMRNVKGANGQLEMQCHISYLTGVFVSVAFWQAACHQIGVIDSFYLEPLMIIHESMHNEDSYSTL